MAAPPAITEAVENHAPDNRMIGVERVTGAAVEWNGRFRDDVRSFFHGEDAIVARISDRLLGSPAIYGHKGRDAEESVNFVTCHDGFTLNDLGSYNQKHNEANGEGNRDGAHDNGRWKCGAEGLSTDPGIEALCKRQGYGYLASPRPIVALYTEVIE